MKKLIAVLVLAMVGSGLVYAQQIRTATQTNAVLTLIEGNVVSTNLTIFTASTAYRYDVCTIQNRGTNYVYVKVGALTGATNAVFTAGGIRLNAAGSNGDVKVLSGVLPDNIVLSGQNGHVAETATVAIELLGRSR